MIKIYQLLVLSLVLLSYQAVAEIPESDAYNHFLDRMVKQHGFQEDELRSLFKSVEIQDAILTAISKPAEAKPWYQYRDIFMTESRIADGVTFWRENQVALEAMESEYGVPAEILIAILGVESRYGAHPGKYRVIDALATLGFAYPSRSEFFLKELENFLLLSRKENMDALQPIGSYAGAMGLPQFMPSSFQSYAVDFDRDGKRDIWHNSADALASVANYFVHNHWQRGEDIAFPVTATGENYRQFLGKGVKPDTTVLKLRSAQIDLPASLAPGAQVKLLNFQQPDSEELWIGLTNFYVITRYNHSPLYAMAVYQLSQAIASRKRAENSALPIQK